MHYTSSRPHASLYSTLSGNALKKTEGYDAHLAAVDENLGFQAAMSTHDTDYVELVVDQECQIVPMALFRVGPYTFPDTYGSVNFRLCFCDLKIDMSSHRTISSTTVRHGITRPSRILSVSLIDRHRYCSVPHHKTSLSLSFSLSVVAVCQRAS